MDAVRVEGDGFRPSPFNRDAQPARDPKRTGFCVASLALLLGAVFSTTLAGQVFAIEASQQQDVLRPTAQWPAPFGVRCETRHQRREVSLRNFVVDRVTHCLPIPLAAGGDAACVTTNDETSPATSPSPSTSTPRSTGELEARRVGWSGNRKRLSNVQHARSLRAMDGLRSRSPR